MARMKLVGVKLPEETIKKLQILADRREWSLSQYVRKVVEQHLGGAAIFTTDLPESRRRVR